MAVDTRAAVVLLTGNNFQTWKLQMRMILTRLGVWRIVDGSEDAPDEYDVVARRKYMERSDKALSNIVLGVDPKLLYLLGDPQDPAEVWELLCNQFQKRSWSNKLALKRKLYGLRLKDQDSVQEHFKSMIEIFDELAVIGDPVEEEDKVVQILTSLPESEVPRLEIVTERILNEERKRKEKCSSSGGPSNSGENALLANNNHGKTRSTVRTCYYCGRPGHIKINCDDLKKKIEEIENMKKREHAVANFSYNQEDSDSDIECIALISEVNITKSKWIIDSAATSHMCNDEKSMQGLTRLENTQRVKVGNGEYLEAKFEGSVKLVVKSGNKTRKVKLHNVLLVPGLKYNLFSVAKAAELGKRVEFIRSGCRIVDIKGRQIVATATKAGKLYHLDCVSQMESPKLNKKESQRSKMEKALLSIRENSFQEEMLRRLSSIEEDKIDLELRLRKFEDKASYESYSFNKEDNQNKSQISETVLLNEEKLVHDTDSDSEIESIPAEVVVKCFEAESEVENSSDEDSLEDISVENCMKKTTSVIEVSEVKMEDKFLEDSNADIKDNCVLRRPGVRGKLYALKKRCSKIVRRAVQSTSRK